MNAVAVKDESNIQNRRSNDKRMSTTISNLTNAVGYAGIHSYFNLYFNSGASLGSVQTGRDRFQSGEFFYFIGVCPKKQIWLGLNMNPVFLPPLQPSCLPASGRHLSTTSSSPTCVSGDLSSLIRHACLFLAGIYLSASVFSLWVGNGDGSKKKPRWMPDRKRRACPRFAVIPAGWWRGSIRKESRATAEIDVSPRRLYKAPRAFCCRDVPVERLQKALSETPANHSRDPSSLIRHACVPLAGISASVFFPRVESGDLTRIAERLLPPTCRSDEQKKRAEVTSFGKPGKSYKVTRIAGSVSWPRRNASNQRGEGANTIFGGCSFCGASGHRSNPLF